jgi:serine/threonine protein phosphatase PrpC
VADGLGHGVHAAVASHAFCDYIREQPDAPLQELLAGGHAALAQTRGAAAALLRIDTARARMEFSGIGNIACFAHSKNPIRPVSTPGILGRHRRTPKSFCYDLHANDLLCVCSDGITSRLRLEEYGDRPVELAAQQILDDQGKYHDDVTCLVIRCGLLPTPHG